VQVTGVEPTQVPPWQLRGVHKLPSPHEEPSSFAGFEHWPVAESQTPVTWQSSLGLHATGFSPWQKPE
jgi:hypothetical protein